MNFSNRLRGPLLRRTGILALLVALWGFAASDRTPASLSSAAHAAQADQVRRKPSAGSEHDLSALKIFNRVVILIKDNYVDPKRVEPRKMLINALDQVEMRVAEIMVEGDENSPTLKVTVNKTSKEFKVTEVDSLWRMSFALKEIFEFINKNLNERDETREIEYAAVNGMLRTLDPHSVLLSPEYFKEMKLQTKGEFGGLGFVIQMKEGNLTVVKVLKGTPAHKGGIKNKDQILQINHESTINMDLNEAVARLRGKPGSAVTITVNRQGFAKPKDFTLKRAIINVESVESKLLSNNIGYIKLKGFQGNTARDMHAQLEALRRQAAKNKAEGGQLKGLVLDMRNNPGGLLDQAIQISDAFLDKGTIVTTVGYSDKLRDVKKAQPDETDSQLPLVVIVNSGSASASEIVSGALKNHDRAVVIGRQTFGKGSVQVLYDFPDESALKLTIAQYLTPGDISIQEVGITPDIQLVPSRVSKERIDVFAPKKLMGEADLDKHFGNPDSDRMATKREEVVPREKPLEELRYLRELTAAEKREERAAADDLAALEELEEADPEEFVEDFQIRFAKEMLLAAPFNSRSRMLAASKDFIEKQRRQEEEKIQKGLEALGIDWSPATGKGAGKARLKATMTAPPRAQAGETLAWTVTVENTGTEPLKRLRAWSESENPWLDRREFVFGAVNPGEKKSWTVNVKLPKDMMSRRDPVTIKFFDDTNATLEDLKGDINIAELPRPAFAYSWQILDKCAACNGDGRIQLGETVELAIDVKNIGAGKAWDAVALLKNKADEHIFIKGGRAKLGEIAAGERQSGTFEFELKPEYAGKAFELQLTMGDEPTGEFISEKISIPVSEAGPKSEKVARQAVKLSEAAPVYASAHADAPKMGELKKGTVIPAEARIGGFYRVKLGNGWGFVPESKAKESRPDPKSTVAFASAGLRSMPKIELGIDLQKGGILTDSERFLLKGVARDEDALRDLYIFVNEQKVFFKSASDPTPNEIRFSADFPLKEGNNTVLVVAREDKELLSRRIFTIHRNSKGELAQKTKPAK